MLERFKADKIKMTLALDDDYFNFITQDILGLKGTFGYSKEEFIMIGAAVFFDMFEFSHDKIQDLIKSKKYLDMDTLRGLEVDHTMQRLYNSMVTQADSTNKLCVLVGKLRIDDKLSDAFMSFIFKDLGLYKYEFMSVVSSINELTGEGKEKIIKVENDEMKRVIKLSMLIMDGYVYNSGKIKDEIRTIEEIVRDKYQLPLSLYIFLILGHLSQMVIMVKEANEFFDKVRPGFHAVMMYLDKDEDDEFIFYLMKFKNEFINLFDQGKANLEEVTKLRDSLMKDLNHIAKFDQKLVSRIARLTINLAYINEDKSDEFYDAIRLIDTRD